MTNQTATAITAIDVDTLSKLVQYWQARADELSEDAKRCPDHGYGRGNDMGWASGYRAAAKHLAEVIATGNF